MTEEKRTVEKLALLGTGIMGRGLAQVSLPVCDTVLMKDVNLEAVADAVKFVYAGLEKQVEKKKMSPFVRDALYGKMVPCDDYSMFNGTDLVIEAVSEDLSLKRKILADVEEATGPETIFASNTSALPISKIARGCKRPEKVIGMHYFSPVPRMPLLEIITTEKTSKDVLEKALSFGREQGKKCIVVRDGPAFYTTRILVAMLNQAARLIDQGADLHSVDDALAAFGFPVGPVTLLDEIGIDTGSHVGEMMREVWEPKGIEMSPLFSKMYEKGLYGRKSGAGFYRYDVPKEGERKVINREALESVGVDSKGNFTSDELQERLVLVMVNEAARCLEEGILSSPEDGDTGAILGLGFPMDKGGPFHYMDNTGMKELVERLEATRKKGGEAYAPADMLNNMAGKGTTFYS